MVVNIDKSIITGVVLLLIIVVISMQTHATHSNDIFNRRSWCITIFDFRILTTNVSSSINDVIIHCLPVLISLQRKRIANHDKLRLGSRHGNVEAFLVAHNLLPQLANLEHLLVTRSNDSNILGRESVRSRSFNEKFHVVLHQLPFFCI